MKFQVDFLLPLKLYHTILGYLRKYSWPISFAGCFTFGLCDLLILIPGVHCYIVLVLIIFVKFYTKFNPTLINSEGVCQEMLHQFIMSCYFKIFQTFLK